jgi:hypothetical protein
VEQGDSESKRAPLDTLCDLLKLLRFKISK